MRPDVTPQEAERSSWDFTEGSEIAPGLSAIKLLGGGLRYEAYLAWSDRLRSLVVAKVVRPALVDDESTLVGLRREMELLGRLDHPVVVRGFGGEPEGSRPHLVLELLEGPRLSSLRRRHGPLLPEQLTSLGIEISAALHYLAGEGIVHLDVKPSNLIMGGPPRLIDLSVAKTIEECGRLRAPVGTDAYMAPEQAVSSDRLGPSADVWGLGVSMYESLAGERPFSRGDPRSASPAERFPQIEEDPRPLSRRAPDGLAEAVMSCLAREPGDRPNAAALGDRLQEVLDGLPRPRLASLKPRSRPPR